MLIRLNNVSKRYGSTPALSQVSFTAEPSQIIAILGSNGAGKTTLLRCLSSVVHPDRGEILYDDRRFRRAETDLRRRLGFLPDMPALLGQVTMLRHIGMVLRLYGCDTAEREPRVLQLLRDFDLLPYIEKHLGQLSRGQLYKAALVAILAAGPELLLLDEPFASGMDPNGISQLKRELRAATSRGATVFYSTQILDIAENFSDRVCVIERGELRYFAPVAELKSQAQSGDGGVLERIFQQLREERS